MTTKAQATAEAAQAQAVSVLARATEVTDKLVASTDRLASTAERLVEVVDALGANTAAQRAVADQVGALVRAMTDQIRQGEAHVARLQRHSEGVARSLEAAGLPTAGPPRVTPTAMGGVPRR